MKRIAACVSEMRAALDHGLASLRRSAAFRPTEVDVTVKALAAWIRFEHLEIANRVSVELQHVFSQLLGNRRRSIRPGRLRREGTCRPPPARRVRYRRDGRRTVSRARTRPLCVVVGHGCHRAPPRRLPCPPAPDWRAASISKGTAEHLNRWARNPIRAGRRLKVTPRKTRPKVPMSPKVPVRRCR